MIDTSTERIEKTIDEIMSKIKEMLSGEKQQDYGNAFKRHARIAEMWGIIDHEYAYPQFENAVGARQAAIKMAEMKLARLEYNPNKEDSYLDAVAYLLFAATFNRMVLECVKESTPTKGEN